MSILLFINRYFKHDFMVPVILSQSAFILYVNLILFKSYSIGGFQYISCVLLYLINLATYWIH